MSSHTSISESLHSEEDTFSASSSIEKTAHDIKVVRTSSKSSAGDDDLHLKELAQVEEKSSDDEPIEEEFRVQEAYEVALKVENPLTFHWPWYTHPYPRSKVLSTQDDPEVPALTFRTMFLGLGFSAFGASVSYISFPRWVHSPVIRSYRVLAQIYYFKPQTLNVSVLFLQVITYWFGTAMHLIMPSKGIFRWLNPGVFNSKSGRVLTVTYLK